MEVKLYTIDCPKCEILEAKLNDKNIKFEKITDEDIAKSLGIDTFPVLEVNGELLKFSDANKWVNSQEGY